MHLVALLLMSTTTMQAPASGAPPIWGGPGSGVPENVLNPPVEIRATEGNGVLDQTERSIDAALRDGSLSRADARAFRIEVRRMRAASGRYRSNGSADSLQTLALALQGQVEARRALRRPN